MTTPRDEYAHLYNSSAWRKGRDAFLRANPLCCYCKELGKLRAAEVVDHVQPHRGDRGLFFDQSNWQPLCKPCHDGVKQRMERSGRRDGVRPDGTPVDPNHPWNREESEPPPAAALGQPAMPAMGIGG